MAVSLGVLAVGMYLPTNAVMEAEARYDREREFHDADSARWGRVERYYEVTGSSHRYFADQLALLAPGSAVLEYGCGEGSSAFTLAEFSLGARGGLTITAVAPAVCAARLSSRQVCNPSVVVPTTTGTRPLTCVNTVSRTSARSYPSGSTKAGCERWSPRPYAARPTCVRAWPTTT